jgi:uncharacterized DUF497 family protein
MRVTWDPDKDLANQRKHGIGFKEASGLFISGVDYLELFDEQHSVFEDRFIAIGPLQRGVVLIVSTERDEETIRIISARWATAHEQSLYNAYREERHD